MRGTVKRVLQQACLLIIGIGVFAGQASGYEVNNDFKPDAFPKETSKRVFSFRLQPETAMVIYPAVAEPQVESMRRLLREKCGSDIPFRTADGISDADLRGRDLIIVGNISNNPRAYDLYRRRFAYADAYFPGAGGVIVTPSESLWDKDRNILVVGVSRDADVFPGFQAFVGQLENGAKTVGPLRHLKTSLRIPNPPASASSIMDFSKGALSPSGTTSTAMRTQSIEDARKSNAVMAPYATIANWGLSYHLTGERKWAEHFLAGMRFCYERARTTGQWIPEPWTNVYFCLWKMVQAWELIDDDPFFTPEDRKLIDEVLWGYAYFCDWLPNLDRNLAPVDEPRQNHTTFLALSHYYSYRYFTGKYGISGLDSRMDKVRMAFDRGEAASSRPNDDAGGYLNYAPIHMLTYQLAENNFSFAKSDKMGKLADLVALTVDNLGDPVGFGDVGGYSRRSKTSGRGYDAIFFSMTANFTGDPMYHWLYDWSTASGERSFNLEEIYYGCYAVEGKSASPAKLLGVYPALLDDGALRWSAFRSWKNGWVPRKGARYFDKLTFRPSFDPGDEYLLIDGTSTYSHGHYDGNTVSRLSWKNYVWLFETDYIKLTPRYHNGVIVTRDGVQAEPAPLTTLDHSADFKSLGFSVSTSHDFNGADWTRSVLWKKGRYFLVLDRVQALREGEYRLEQRWRSRGEGSLRGNTFTAEQDDAVFTILTADDAPRRFASEPEVSINYARRDLTLSRNDSYTFASLLFAEEKKTRIPRELRREGETVYLIRDGASEDLVGLDSSLLAARGVATDCALFTVNAENLTLAGATVFRSGTLSLQAPAPVHLQAEYRKPAGVLTVPEGAEGMFRLRGITITGVTGTREGLDSVVELKSGSYAFTLSVPLPDLRPLLARYAAGSRAVNPGKWPAPFADFGFGERKMVSAPDSVTAFCSDGDHMILGDAKGNLSRFDGNSIAPFGRVESGKPVIVLHAADIDNDGASEIIAGDAAEGIFCFKSDGKLLWNQKLTRFYSSRANATSIDAARIDNSGKTAVLVGTEGWKLYAFEPDGTPRGEGFSFYHPMTKVKYFRNGPGEAYIATGTTYQTPLNVFAPETGKNLWYTWEEMGSEFISRTQYCGYSLTDMVFLDTDGDGNKEIVFGTKYNTIYALNARDGACKWETNVG
ncbi:MAG: hypothetical protein ACYC9O_12965, partial [Candidatus Latescibacterota bacterium]